MWIAAHNVNDAIEIASEKFSVPRESINSEQDEDVLDTWFSSALLPFSVHGWPGKVRNFYFNAN